MTSSDLEYLLSTDRMCSGVNGQNVEGEESNW